MTETLQDYILQSVRKLAKENFKLEDGIVDTIYVKPNRDLDKGAFTSNVAVVVSKNTSMSLPASGAALMNLFQANPDFKVETKFVAPAFYNFFPPRDHEVADLQAVVPRILIAGEFYGYSNVGQGITVNVEYVSANPTGPLHVGHCRGAVVGDALANLLARAGFHVTKEYLINDAGGQVTALAWAAYWRYLEALGTPDAEALITAAAPGGLQYKGDYLIPVGDALVSAHGDRLAASGGGIADPALWLVTVRDFAIDQMMAGVRADLALLGVRFDVFSSEAALAATGATDAVIERLQRQGLIYEGTLEPPKGKTPDDWEAREQTLFRATSFGDDLDRPLRKSDGAATYFANDIAYHADKLARGAEIMIDVWGADHGGYVSRMVAATAALGGKLDIVLCQIVHVLKDGVPVRMSKRAGTYITLRDLIEEAGRDAVRFTMLTRKHDAQMEFDIAKAIAQTRENPVFYVQYAHARSRSVLRAASDLLPSVAESDLAGVDLSSLTDEAELALLRRLASWPRLLEAAALAREPHRIAFFLYDLAGDFHMLWNRGRDHAALRFLQPDDLPATTARVALVAATAVVIRSGLAILGVQPVEEMR